MRLERIKVKGFRGFNTQREISLDADVILIYGLNGAGKSSFTEALEWLFFGDISRRKLSPCKSEYQYEEYLKNLFYTDSENPFVEIGGIVKGKQIIIRKELITEKQSKNFINDEEVKDFNSLSLNLESYSRPMLAQTEIAALVNTEQKDRWEQLSYILGQEDLTRLRQHLIELRKDKKDPKYTEAEKEFEGILVDLRRIDELRELCIVFERFDIQGIYEFIRKLILNEGIDVSPENLGDAIKIKLGGILGGDLAKRVVELKLGTSKDFVEWTNNSKGRFKELEDCILNTVREKVDFDKVEFLKKGKKFAKIPECPFCMQSTLTEDRMSKIDKEISSADKASNNKVKCDSLIKEINSELNSAQIKEAIRLILPSSQELKIIAQKLSDLDLKDLAGKLQAYQREIDDFLNSKPIGLSTQVTTYMKALEDFYFHKDKSVVPDTTQKILFDNFTTVSKTLDSFLSKWITIRGEIVRLLLSPSASAQKEVEKWILVDKVNNFLVREERFFRKKKLLELVDGIQSKLESFEKSEVERLLTEHSEEIRDYYNRLNPDEKILFKKIEVKDVTRRQARLVAEAYGKEINPVTIFSTAHTNSLSLSIYFPQRVDRNLTWELVILDDPVQSMDHGHSFSLIEILSEIKSKKQVIVLTHSKSFAEDFVNRFNPTEVLYYEFVDGGEDGPIIRIRQGKTLDYLEFVKKNLNGNQIERQSAGNALRSAIASVCGEILLSKGRTLIQIRNSEKEGLGRLFDQLERARMDSNDLNKLKVLVNQVHADSHAWTIRDTTPPSLSQGIKNVEEVYNKHAKPQ